MGYSVYHIWCPFLLPSTCSCYIADIGTLQVPIPYSSPPFDIPLTGQLAKENSARWSADGTEVWKYMVWKCWSIRNGTESGLRKNGSHWITSFYPGNPLPLSPLPQEYPPRKIMYLGSQIQRNGIYWPYRLQEKVKAKGVPYKETQA